MKISYNWLKEYINVKESPAKLAEILTKSGSEVKAIDRVGGDSVMDIEVTPNRSDCLSYLGIAREVSSMTGKTIKAPPLKVQAKTPSARVPFTVEIEDKDLCPRYTARLIRDVKVGESPDWLKKKIVAMGLRPVNNVADITNFVLFELGQPMHAFDYDKIKGNAVIIRRARGGEDIVSIDNVKRGLEKDMLIIADRDRPIAVGGVMGGLDTEVGSGTTNILLESAYFNPVSVRRTSFKLALMSESSYRFERGVDPLMVLGASDRAALLIKDLCGGKIAELVDKGAKPEKKRIVNLRMRYLNEILNLNLKEGYVKKVLSGLFLKTSSKKGALKVSIPSFRQDIRDEIDLVEEVSRIYGYEKIATTIPQAIPNPERKSLSFRARELAAGVLTSLGLNEVITYSLLSKTAINKLFPPSGEFIAVKNPLSAEQEMMRPSLVPGVLNVLNYNMNRGVKDLKIFEMGAVYCKDSKTGYSEKTYICIALTGLASKDWQRPKGDVTFFDLRGTLEMLFSKLGLEIEKLTIGPGDMPSFWYKEILQQGKVLKVDYTGEWIGFIGTVPAAIRDAFDLGQEIPIAEINLNILEKYISFDKKFKDIPKFPSIKRDVSLIASSDVSFKKIALLVKEKGTELVEKVELFDKYTGKHIPLGHHGLSFRIEYRDRNMTLTAGDVDKIHSAIRKSLVEKLGVTLR